MTAVLLGFLNLTNDEFKIIITLRQAQKFGDTGPYKNFDFLFNRLLTAGFFVILAEIGCSQNGNVRQ